VQLEAFATPHVARKQQQFRPAPGFFGNNPAINPPGACKNNYARYLRRKGHSLYNKIFHKILEEKSLPFIIFGAKMRKSRIPYTIFVEMYNLRNRLK